MAVDRPPKAPKGKRTTGSEATPSPNPKPVGALQVVHDRWVNKTPRWERVLKAACEDGDLIVSVDGKQISVKLAAVQRYYDLARQAFPIDDYDLFEDVIAQIKFGKLTREQEHAQLRRLLPKG